MAERCVGKKANGKPCKNGPRKGLSTCYRHRDQDPKVAIRPASTPPENMVTFSRPWMHTRETAPVSDRVRFFYPEDEPLPDVYVKPRPVPCQHCRCERLPSTSQAVVIRVESKGMVYFRCRNCKEQFKMAMR